MLFRNNSFQRKNSYCSRTLTCYYLILYSDLECTPEQSVLEDVETNLIHTLLPLPRPRNYHYPDTLPRMKPVELYRIYLST